MSNQELLREKAILVCDHCGKVGLPLPQYRIIPEYQVNFIWRYEGSQHTASLYCNSKQEWKIKVNTDWGKQVILPALQPLFGLSQAEKPVQRPVSEIERKQSSTSSTPEIYFSDAVACLSLLAPFSHDNIDFSIICEKARQAVIQTLHDPAFAYLKREALQLAIESPNRTNFLEAKEYLTLCLTLCKINSSVS